MTGRLANRRIRLLLAVFAVVFGLTLLRAVWLQGVRAQSLGAMAAKQHRQTLTIPAGRGAIYDRTGVQLAIGESATTVYADPKQIGGHYLGSIAEAQHGESHVEQFTGTLGPSVRAIVPVVDLPGRRVVIDPPPGLLDLAAGRPTTES